MPDQEGAMTGDEWAVALNWNEPTPVPVVPAPDVKPVEPAPVSKPAEAPKGIDYSAQSAAIADQQYQLQLQQQATAYERQLVEQQKVAPDVARIAAGNWANREWFSYKQNDINKQNLVKSLSDEFKVDPAYLQQFQDPGSMRVGAMNAAKLAAAEGRISSLEATPKAPIQSFHDGAATSRASTDRAAVDYVQGKPGNMSRAEFIKHFGCVPD